LGKNGGSMISYCEAYRQTMTAIAPLEPESVELLAAGERIAALDLHALIDSPSVDVSLKDGYAVLSEDIRIAKPESPVRLFLAGSVAAGANWSGSVHPGQAVSDLSGAPLPQGADAILSEEFVRIEMDSIQALNHAEVGRNILRRGSDVACGSLIVPAGQRLSPMIIGLLAAAGYQQVAVVRRPRVAILATGDEVLAPGQEMVEGKLYASNLFTLAAWCRRYGFEVNTFVVGDDPDQLRQKIVFCLNEYDALLTSGGAWKGEHDLVVQILDGLGWRKIYHRVRIGPGKAIGFGLFNHKPIFCLPGGPPSNHMAFLQFALPGLQALAGDAQPGLPTAVARMAQPVTGQVDWTQFIHGRLRKEDLGLVFEPLVESSRLQMMAQTEAIAMIPEGREALQANEDVLVQLLTSSPA
jgi:molybdopterin molybdotransferase